MEIIYGNYICKLYMDLCGDMVRNVQIYMVLLTDALLQTVTSPVASLEKCRSCTKQLSRGNKKAPTPTPYNLQKFTKRFTKLFTKQFCKSFCKPL